MDSIIIAGSEGLVGKSLEKHLKKTFNIISLDLSLGHDLNDEDFVKEFFSDLQAFALINTFAIDDKEDNKFQHSSLNCDLSQVNKFLQTNVTALLSVCREYIKNNNSGRIINFSSIYGQVSPKKIYGEKEKFIGYGISKAGVDQLTRHLAMHNPSFLINAISPGGIDNNQSEDFKNLYSEHTPLKRLMDVKELNALVDFLLSKQSMYTTGSILKIDGGWTSW